MRFEGFRRSAPTQTSLRDVNDSTPNCLRSCAIGQRLGNPPICQLRESRQSIARLPSCARSRGRVPDRDSESSAIVQASRFHRFKPRLDSSPWKRLGLIWALSSEDSGSVSRRLRSWPLRTLDRGSGREGSGLRPHRRWPWAPFPRRSPRKTPNSSSPKAFL